MSLDVHGILSGFKAGLFHTRPRMNGFSTEEDSHDGPPAPPFYGQSCCLIEDGERCGRSAGNASFSKRIQKSISQKKLKLDIDKSVSRGGTGGRH